MFELEEYSSGFHDNFLSKYTDATGPTLDYYVSDSIQDILDIDIRAEIANIVGSTSEFTSPLDNPFETTNNNNSSNNNINNMYISNQLSSTSINASPTAKWMGSTNSSSWATSSDYYADIGACVNPISVMPLISTSLLQNNHRVNLNSSATSPPPASPIAERDPTKSHLTFSPAQIKISAGSMRREQVHAHIPKQIVTVSSVGGSSTTVPATMATNSVLQRKFAAESVKKDLAVELHKTQTLDDKQQNDLLSSNSNATNTIKLAPGIGGLTFANSVTYNKLKQQHATKSSHGTLVLKRDRDSSPLHNMATLNTNSNLGGNNKRNFVQPTNSYTPKSIASAAHSPHFHNNNLNSNNSSIGSPTSSSISSTSSGNASPYHGVFSSMTPLSSTSNLVNIANNTNVKPLQQRIKAANVEPEYPKPAYSYSCLIAMALKNSRSGSLPVSEIYSFMCEHFPYFKKAPSGWKNSVRHNLSLNKCFEKIEKPATNGNQRKGCLWAMNPERISKMDEEVLKWSRKDPNAIRNAMIFPEHLEALERGELKHGSADSDIELDSQSEIEETSDLEEHEYDDTLVDNMLAEVEEDDQDNDNEGIDTDAEDREDDLELGDILHNQQEEQQQQQQEEQEHHERQLDDLLEQKQTDFDDVEVSLETHMIEKSSLLYEKIDDFYDEIEIEDNKEELHMRLRNNQTSNDIIELNPADINNVNRRQSLKRTRLDMNYSIGGSTGELEQKQQQQQQPQPQKNYRKVVVQSAQVQLQPQIYVQPISGNQQFQQINNLGGTHASRRKMQLVSRIV